MANPMFYLTQVGDQAPEAGDCQCHRVKKCEKICKVKSKEIWSESVYTNDLCAVSGTINDLCVTNLNVSNLKGSLNNNTRAFINFTGDFSYTLGTDINFNNVIDDPSSGVSFSPTTHYTAPVAGYYSANAFIDFNKLAGTVIISGIPIAALSIWVNGIERQASYVPFLSFSLEQQGALSNTLVLAAGDQVTVRLDVLIIDPNTGQQPYVGTVTLKGGAPVTGSVSTFNIVLLTPMTGSHPITCETCPTVVTTGCEPGDDC